MNNLRILCLEENPEGPEPSVSRQLSLLDGRCIPFHSFEIGQNLPWDLIYCGTDSGKGKLQNGFTDALESLDWDILFFDIRPGTVLPDLEEMEKILARTSILKVCRTDLPGLGSRLFGRDLKRKDFFPNLIDLFSIELLIVTDPASGVEFFYRGMPDKLLSVSSGAGRGEKKRWESGFTGGFIYFFLRGDRLYKAAEKAVALADYTAGLPSRLPELGSGIRQQLGLNRAG